MDYVKIFMEYFKKIVVTVVKKTVINSNLQSRVILSVISISILNSMKKMGKLNIL